MEIKYVGHSCFHIRTASAKIVTDPFTKESTGLPLPKIEADIVTISHDHDDHNNPVEVKGDPLVLTWPGEFEKKGVHITGFPTFHDGVEGQTRGENVMYKFEDGDISLLHCGDLGHLLSDDMVERVGNIDILMIPVGDIFTIGPKDAVKVIKAIEPSIVIPMHFGRPDLRADVFAELQPLATFLKEFGQEGIEPLEKLTLKKDQINTERTEVVVLRS